MPYIANKPIRFDKNYSVGEIIPDNIIDPKMKKRLIDWGKIIFIKPPDLTEATPAPDLTEDKNSKKNSSKKK